MVSDADADMDIPFTLVVDKDISQVARLLQMIYRNNYYYCIHVDMRSSSSFIDALKGIANCFGANVELVPHDERVAVNWGDETGLVPQNITLRGSIWSIRLDNVELVVALKAMGFSET
uniref:Protein xylosyltransferase n=1 Tax=Mesocestoides corti TaxID=53468 RepID=A0A5K3G009_MESCO